MMQHVLQGGPTGAMPLQLTSKLPVDGTNGKEDLMPHQIAKQGANRALPFELLED
jgi:hypothetical protein